jgi:carbon monoxide dehydrogenase subunit G
VKITGTYTIDAPQDQVWAALNDMEVLARIVPGCERLDQIGENEYEGTVKIGIQAIKGTYNGRIRIEDIQPPHHYKLIASGRSANGVVDGAGTVDLAEQDGKTILTYGGDAQIGGMLASVGQRLIEGASKQMINQSLKALVEQISLRNSSSPAAEGTETAAPAETTTTPAENGAAPAAQAYAAAAPVAAMAVPVTPAAPPEPEPMAFERRSVVVPDHEQLKPESIVRGIVDDMIRERPWLPWVILAFLLGVVFGRRRH